jgi:hypothetical protein
MAGEPPKPQSWWQTLPGILTAVAGIITAATGLIVALNQAGFFSPGEKKDSSTSTQTSISSAGKPDKPPTDVVAHANELERKWKPSAAPPGRKAALRSKNFPSRNLSDGGAITNSL